METCCLFVICAALGYSKGKRVGMRGDPIHPMSIVWPFLIFWGLYGAFFAYLYRWLDAYSLWMSFGAFTSCAVFYVGTLIAGFQIGKHQHIEQLQIDHERSSKLKPSLLATLETKSVSIPETPLTPRRSPFPSQKRP